jgi:GT2 family glycosyltransferase
MKLSVIIVNHNTSELLVKCVENLQSMSIEKEILVVDNGSTDDSAKVFKEKFPELTLIEQDNLGLAKGYNAGFDRSTGEYILFLGTDAYPKEEDLTGIMSYMDGDNSVGIATAKLVLRSGLPDPDAHRGFPTPWAAFTHFSKLNRLFPRSKMFNSYFLGHLDPDTPHEIDLCIAHFMMVRRDVFDSIGKWDEDYFLYGEDVDFCYRTKEAGWKIMYLPQFEVLHYKGASVGVRKETKDISKKSPEFRKRMRKESTKAMKIFYRKHYSTKYPPFVTKAVLTGIDALDRIRGKL